LTKTKLIIEENDVYDSDNGNYKDKGTSLHTTITGQGLLPCGNFKCTVASVSEKDGIKTLIIDESARGCHIEMFNSPLPSWIEVDLDIDVEIRLGEGVYARRNSSGKLALFDAITNEQKSKWTTNIIPYLRHHRLAEPSIRKIRNASTNDEWRRTDNELPTE
jgi:hypothetical protein